MTLLHCVLNLHSAIVLKGLALACIPWQVNPLECARFSPLSLRGPAPTPLARTTLATGLDVAASSETKHSVSLGGI